MYRVKSRTVINYARKTTSLVLMLLISSLSTAAIFEVNSIADSGVGSLRQAITDANSTVGADEIRFNIDEADCDLAGVCHIAVLSDLPDITEELFIDGTTQAQYGTAPANVCATESAASYMRVELNGIDTIRYIILKSNETSVVKGLSIGREDGINNGDAIRLHTDANHWIYCNHLGINAEGTENLGIRNGICISCTSPFGNNGLIGTNSDGLDDIAERNLISGTRGIRFNTSSNFIVSGNYFALTADGLTGLSSNLCLSGRQITTTNRFGSNLDGIYDAIERNIFGSCTTALDFGDASNGTTNMIAGNWIGLNVNGDSIGVTTGIRLRGNNTNTLVALNWIESADTAIELAESAMLQTGSTDNCITNSTIGLNHLGTSLDQAFINNWWGDASGPSGIGAGTGAPLLEPSTGTVIFDPWNTVMPEDCFINLDVIFENGFE